MTFLELEKKVVDIYGKNSNTHYFFQKLLDMHSHNRRYMPLHALPKLLDMSEKVSLINIYKTAVWFSQNPQKLLNHYFEFIVSYSNGDEEEISFTFEEVLMCLQGEKPWINPNTGHLLETEVNEENLFPYFVQTELLKKMSIEWKQK